MITRDSNDYICGLLAMHSKTVDYGFLQNPVLVYRSVNQKGLATAAVRNLEISD